MPHTWSVQRTTTPARDSGAVCHDPGAWPLRLSRQMMVDRSGEERRTALPRPSVDRAAGGLDPDVVAQLFGRTAATPNGARHERTQPRRLEVLGPRVVDVA